MRAASTPAHLSRVAILCLTLVAPPVGAQRRIDGPSARATPRTQILLGRLVSPDRPGGAYSLDVGTMAVNLSAVPSGRTFVGRRVRIEGGAFYVRSTPERAPAQVVRATFVALDTTGMSVPTALRGDGQWIGTLEEGAPSAAMGLEGAEYQLRNVVIPVDIARVNGVAALAGKNVSVVGQFKRKTQAGRTSAWVFEVRQVRDEGT